MPKNQDLEMQETQLCSRILARILEHRSAPQQHTDRPRIGIFASSGTIREGAWPIYGGDQFTIDAIAESGGVPVLLPIYPIIPGMDAFDILSDENAFRRVFDTIWPLVRDVDGLIFTGGGDVDSRFFYRKVPHPQLGRPDIWRDIWEWVGARISWTLFRATFGICRGAQLMNVARGGELLQDQDELRQRWKRGMPPLLVHRKGRPTFKNFCSHPLQIVPGSTLAQAVQGRSASTIQHYYLDNVLSQHHNFICALGSGLEANGYAPDGVVESFAAKDTQRSYWAVQFHPEFMKSLAWSRNIFTYVVEQSARDMTIPRPLLESFREEVFAWTLLNGKVLHELKVEELPLVQTERKTDEIQHVLVSFARG